MDSSAPKLPTPTGLYAVGTATFFWRDPTRPEPLIHTPPDSCRTVGVQIFYPARGAQGEPAQDEAEHAALTAWLTANSWPDDEAQRLRDVYGRLDAHVEHGAAPVGDGARYPVILFAPGGYQSRLHYTSFCVELASRGYVIAALSQPFAGIDFFPEFGLLGRHVRWTAPKELETRTATDVFNEPMTEVLGADARFVLDRLIDIGPALAGMLDLDRVGIVGHSRGGRTVSRACASDKRFTAGALLDALPPSRELADGFGQPMMYLRVAPGEGEHWPRASGLARWTPELIDALDGLVRAARAPAYDVVFTGLGHMSFSDRALIESARFSATVDAEAARAMILAYLLAFFDRHLKGEPAGPLLRGERAFAEATLANAP